MPVMRQRGAVHRVRPRVAWGVSVYRIDPLAQAHVRAERPTFVQAMRALGFSQFDVTELGPMNA